jgi:hypothetical protein
VAIGRREASACLTEDGGGEVLLRSGRRTFALPLRIGGEVTALPLRDHVPLTSAPVAAVPSRR